MDSDLRPSELTGFFYLEGACVRPVHQAYKNAHSDGGGARSTHKYDAASLPPHCFQLVGSCGALLLQAKDQGEQLTWASTLYYAVALCNSADFVQVRGLV